MGARGNPQSLPLPYKRGIRARCYSRVPRGCGRVGTRDTMGVGSLIRERTCSCVDLPWSLAVYQAARALPRSHPRGGSKALGVLGLHPATPTRSGRQALNVGINVLQVQDSSNVMCLHARNHVKYAHQARCRL